jgi:hypothetical protein
MSRAQGLHRLEGGAARRRLRAFEALERREPCLLCGAPAAALVERWDGSLGLACEPHAARAAELGYRVVRSGEGAT